MSEIYVCWKTNSYHASDVAISCPGNLWYRQGVTPSYPQGSSWEHISNNVRKVSVGPLDQVSTRISVLKYGTFSLLITFCYYRYTMYVSSSEHICQFDWDGKPFYY